jgi:AMP-binding enzyme
MILGNPAREAGPNRATLNDLFRRAGVRHPQTTALIDPPNRESITAGAARCLNFAQADRAISNLAARLLQLDLPADTVVAMQLPNTVESVITLLGVLRAGMIVAPLPLLWRKLDMVSALSSVGAKAIITSTRIGHVDHGDIAMQVAAELFPIRYVCAFGDDPPDGVVPLEGVFAPQPVEFAHPLTRAGNAADHVAAVTFDIAGNGPVAIARSHSEVIAGGMAALLEGGIAEDTTILSAIPLGSFAGLALTLVPWLIAGGALTLHHGFDAIAFGEQCRTFDVSTAVLPAAALVPLLQAGLLDGQIRNVIALWRAPERLATSDRWSGACALTDVASFGEAALLPARRGPERMPAPIPCGVIAAPRGAASAIPVAECIRTKTGTLALRGPMVPVHAFPPHASEAAEPGLAPDTAGFIDTGYACRRERGADTFIVTGPPPGVTTIGGYRFRQNEVDWLIAKVDLDATLVAVPNASLGQCFAGSAPDLPATEAELRAQGVNPLIAGAFRPRGQADAA